MALAPKSLHPVPPTFLNQSLPQIGVRDRLFRRGLPAVFLPAEYPFGDAVANIYAVGGQLDVAAALQRGERLDRGHQFHAVVRRIGLAPRQGFYDVAPAQHGAPATRAGIALARAVGGN